MSNQHLNCAKCQQKLNYLPYHSYAEPPAMKSKDGQIYCFDCFKSVSHCKVCDKSVAQMDINIHDKKTWYQPWEKIYWREAEHIKPFDMCGKYCDFLCSPECFAQDDNRHYEVRMKKKQAELAKGWKNCEECVETFEDLFAEQKKEFREQAIANHAYLVPPSEKICKFHKRQQAKDLYIKQVIYPKAQKWWDLLSHEQKLAKVREHDITWIATEKRFANHEEVASRKEVPSFIISQEFEHEEPCITCGKVWKCAGEINCGKNSPDGKISYCASCPPSSPSTGTKGNGTENETKNSPSSVIIEIEEKKAQLQKLKEQGENTEEVAKLEQEIQELLTKKSQNNFSPEKVVQKNNLTPWIVGGVSIFALFIVIITVVKTRPRKSKKL